jgi:type IV fimbrial biogenesis protein FimT
MSAFTVRCLRPNHPKLVGGFTIVELLVTIAIVAILAGIALPSYREFTIRSTVTSNVNGLVGALNIARSEAVKRGRRVAVMANGGSWIAGWQVVVGELDGGGAVLDPVSPGSDEASCSAYVDSSNMPLCPRFEGPVAATYGVLGAALGPAPENDRVTFGSTGVLVGATGFDFSVCRPSSNPDPAQSRRVHIEASGIITTYRGTSDSPAGTCG